MHPRCTLLGLLLATASWAGSDGGTRGAPMELRRNMPLVQVQVNGHGPYTFGIDTGTGTEAPSLVRATKIRSAHPDRATTSSTASP